MTAVYYFGFLGPVLRLFDTRAEAEKWARDNGRYSQAQIFELDDDTKAFIAARGA